ncbi:MAG: alpha/beta hydrolase [Pseudomonadota bacterium]
MFRMSITTMEAKLTQLLAADGHQISVRIWDTPEPPRAWVQICHGLGEHCARYDRLAQTLVAQGYKVIAHDHRGHGPTTACEYLGHYADDSGWQKVVGDVHTVRQHAQTSHAEVPVVLLGHSMGSYIAQAYLMRYPQNTNALVLSGSTSIKWIEAKLLGLIATAERLRQGKRGYSKLLARLSFGAFNKRFEPARTSFDWLSRDPAEVDKYVADPFCGFDASNQLWRDLVGGLAEIAPVNALKKIPDLPILIIGGKEDPVSAGNKLGKLAENYRESGHNTVDLRLYDGARHEIYNETNRDEITADTIEWLENALQGTKTH